jgi:hypothetical protein
MQGRANAFRMFVVIGHCCSPEVRKQKKPARHAVQGQEKINGLTYTHAGLCTLEAILAAFIVQVTRLLCNSKTQYNDQNGAAG